MIFTHLIAFLAGALCAGLTLGGAMVLFAWWMTREAEYDADFGDLENDSRYGP